MIFRGTPAEALHCCLLAVLCWSGPRQLPRQTQRAVPGEASKHTPGIFCGYDEEKGIGMVLGRGTRAELTCPTRNLLSNSAQSHLD